jgi:predicted TIM-barrel fold metal-dependent hydrolase
MPSKEKEPTFVPLINNKSMENRNRVDVHTHCIPDFYHKYLQANGIKHAGGNQFPKWSVEEHLTLMDKNGITKSILSISMPGVHLGNDVKAREMARRVNDYTADIAVKHPDRFGFFATLTLPDIDGAINEMNYAFDHLKAKGIILMTNVEDKYVGDTAYIPLFKELNKRKAIVFVHPNDLPKGLTAQGVPAYAADFLLNTVRAAITLVQSGTMSTYTDLKVILAHAGGFLPYVATRISTIGGTLEEMAKIQLDLKRFYFDIAVSSSPTVFPSLLAFTDSKHILYGSDWPFAPDLLVNKLTDYFDSYEGLTTEQKEDINYKNAGSLNL